MMVRISAIVILVAVAIPIFASDAPIRLAPNQSDVGKLPRGWSAAQTGDGSGSVWKVVADASTPSKTGFALAQSAKGANALFNICVSDQARFGPNVRLKVSLKAIEGELDQGGGLVWLYQDAKNYYVTRFNPLEDNFRLYYVKDGKRIQLATKEGIELDKKAWHTIDVTHTRDAITCTLDGKFKLEVLDKTFAEPGKVGLWTKADARTYFDGFEAAETK
jgi:hypothetical protein